MSNCDNIRELLVLYSDQELGSELKREVDQHLAGCDSCRKESAKIETIQEWLADPILFAPEEDYAWQLLPQTIAARATGSQSRRSWLPVNSGSLGWAMSMAACLLLACGSIWMLQRDTSLNRSAAPGNAAFMTKMQSAYAREATSQYLTSCEDLLLSVVSAEKNCDGEGHDVSIEVSLARELLQRKRMLDVELRAPDVSRAKELCDELENFLVNISTSDNCETPDKLRRLEHFIQREQLLLRINLLQSELS